MKAIMKIQNIRWTSCIAICSVLIAAGVSLGAQPDQAPSADAEKARGAAAIDGAWRLTITLKNCQTGQAIGAPFHSLLTFASGGAVTGTTSNPLFAPGQRTGDFGSWIRTGPATFSALTEALINFTGGAFVTGSQVIAHKISLSDGGNSFTDEASVRFFDANGSQTTPPESCAVAIGQRF